MPQVTSTRWCPTPEQLMILEDIYRSGFRTPNASQIQKITAHLACYGRIEGKNVFYWFQNHKARERQKLRRRLFTRVQHHHHHQLLCSGQPHLFPLLPHPTAADVVHGAIPFHHFPHQDSTRGQNLLREIEGGSGRDEEQLSEASSTNIRCQWMAMMDASGSSTTINPPCCRPLQTLDLFPTRSTGLKDECNSSKSSSSALVQIL